MESTLIKILLAVLFVLNIPVLSVHGQEEAVTQYFYVLTDEPIEEMESNLKDLKEEDIPVILTIDPEGYMNQAQIKTIQKLEKEIDLKVIVQDKAPLNETHFATKGYDEKIELAGRYTANQSELVYKGAKDTRFSRAYLPSAPDKVLDFLDEQVADENYAVLLDGENFNLSNILLFEEEKKGEALDTKDYTYEIEELDFVYRLFTYVGDISIILFSFAIIVFSGAIIVFRRWSLESFVK